MSDPEDKAASAAIPGWQRGQPDDAAATPKDDGDGAIDVARRFLDDDEIKAAPRDKKVTFLKAKGISDGDIQKLLGEPEETEKAVVVGV